MRLSLVILLLFFSFPAFADWPLWRGPTKDGKAAESEKPPVSWSETENVLWKVKVPGRGHSSPTIVGDRIFLTTADEAQQVQAVLCFSRESGKLEWRQDVLKGSLPAKIHKKNTHASPTVMSNGETVFATFFQGGGVHVICLDLDGNEKWRKRVGDYKGQYNFGYAPTPCFFEDNLIVASDFGEGGFLASLSQKDGSENWRTKRGEGTSYSSPIVANVSGKPQLLISGLDKVASYDPVTGKELWQVEGTTSATCGTMVWNEDTVFASGGYPAKQTIAVKGDGSGTVLWKNGEKSYEQSMLYHEGFLYTLNDNGIALCWNAKTGEEKWKVRLGGPVSSSPILAGGNIYATNERGICFVFPPNPEEFVKLAENQLGEEGFATPSFVDNRVYIRTATNESAGRQEWLYCVGE